MSRLTRSRGRLRADPGREADVCGAPKLFAPTGLAESVCSPGGPGCRGSGVSWPRLPGVPAAGGCDEVCVRAFELLAGEEDVYFFVVEGNQARDGLELASGEMVGPGEVWVGRAADAGRPVPAGGALVGAGGDGVTRGQVFGVDLRLVDVVPGGQACFEDHDG